MRHLISKLCLGIMALSIGASLIGTAPAHSASITTLFAGNNNGSEGGAVYFDLTTNSDYLTITGFETNAKFLTAGPTFGFEVYTMLGTSVGNQTNLGLWTSVATGVGTDAGLNNPSPIVLDNTFQLSANTTYGIALILNGPAGSAKHYYTNGTGANQNYANADLSLAFGSATNVPFTGTIFSPRVWNGTIIYEVGGETKTNPSPTPEPSTMILLGTGLVGIVVWRKKQTAF